MYERTIDVDGSMICPSAKYHEARAAIQNFIDEMESQKVDRSDMYVMLMHLQAEAHFHLSFLSSRMK